MRNALFHNLAQYQARYVKPTTHTKGNAMRNFIVLFLAFTFGATLAAVKYERKCTDLVQDAQHAYHEGFLNGRADEQVTREYYQTERYLTVEPTTITRIEEDSPEWDCATMGNKICGPKQ